MKRLGGWDLGFVLNSLGLEPQSWPKLGLLGPDFWIGAGPMLELCFFCVCSGMTVVFWLCFDKDHGVCYLCLFCVFFVFFCVFFVFFLCFFCVFFVFYTRKCTIPDSWSRTES